MSNFDHLCGIDALGIEENHLIHDENLYKENEWGWYEKALMWPENKVSLNNKKSESLRHLKSPLKRLEQNPETFKAHDQVIGDQLVNNVICRKSFRKSKRISKRCRVNKIESSVQCFYQIRAWVFS